MLWITGCPAFMKRSDAVRNSYQQRAVQATLFTERLDTMNGVLNAVRISHDQRSHLKRMGKPVLRAIFGIVFSTTIRVWLAAFGYTDMLAILLRIFHTERRSGNGIKVKPAFANRFEGVKVVLLAGSQQVGDHHQLKDIEDKGLISILLPGRLQLGVMMLAALKTSKVGFSPLTQVDGATDIAFAGNRTGDAINAGNVREVLMVQWGHSFSSPNKALSLGIDRAINTVYAASMFPHSTTSRRFLSTFMNFSPYDCLLSFMPGGSKGVSNDRL